MRANRVTLCAACVTDLTGVEDDNGAPIACSPKMVREFLAIDVRILEQFEKAVEHHSAFLSKRSTSSLAT